MYLSSHYLGGYLPGGYMGRLTGAAPLLAVSTVQPFRRVLVDYMVRGQARVTWELARHFLDPDPGLWQYTLQASRHDQLPSFTPAGALRPDDWVDVGSPLVDPGQLTDTAARAFGKTLSVSYRVRLTTSRGVYYSPPASVLARLPKQDWLHVQEIFRKETLLHQKRTSNEGLLLRRRRSGPACTRCLDERTNEATRSRCLSCLGTGYQGGYFPAVPGSFCRVEPNETREAAGGATGSEKKDVTRGRLIAVPGLESQDVWVDGDSDLRFQIHVTGVIAKIRGLPVVM